MTDSQHTQPAYTPVQPVTRPPLPQSEGASVASARDNRTRETGMQAFKPRHWVILGIAALIALMAIVGMIVGPSKGEREQPKQEPVPTDVTGSVTSDAQGDDDTDAVTVHYTGKKGSAKLKRDKQRGKVQEDSPKWDCRYNGNRICGPYAKLPNGQRIGPNGYNCVPGYGKVILGKSEGTYCYEGRQRHIDKYEESAR